jgi:predicted nucleic acid-binding protein
MVPARPFFIGSPGWVRCTFDTNILVYTLGQPADVKRQRAQSLIIRGARRQTAVLLLQSLAEFSYAATRKFGVSVASVRRRLSGWCGGFPVQPAAEAQSRL